MFFWLFHIITVDKKYFIDEDTSEASLCIIFIHNFEQLCLVNHLFWHAWQLHPVFLMIWSTIKFYLNLLFNLTGVIPSLNIDSPTVFILNSGKGLLLKKIYDCWRCYSYFYLGFYFFYIYTSVLARFNRLPLTLLLKRPLLLLLLFSLTF